MGVAHIVQVAGNFYLHAVAEGFVLLNAGKAFGKGILVVLRHQVTYHAEHLLHSLGKGANLLLCLEHREFGRLHDTGGNELQAEFLLVIGLFGLDDPADKALNQRHEPKHQQRVQDIESRVERSQYNGRQESKTLCLGIHGRVETCYLADDAEERPEQKQSQDNTHHVDGEMGKGCPSGRRVGIEGGNVRRDGGSDVLTQHQQDALVNVQYACGTEHHGDGHDGCRRLYAERQHGTYHEKEERVPKRQVVETDEEALDGIIGLRIFHQRQAGVLQGHQSQEEECRSKEEVTHNAPFLPVYQDNAD